MRIDLTGVSLDMGQIAEISGVTRAAVGNWRSRYDDFPVPDPAGRFNAREIEDWLIERGRIADRLDVSDIVWALMDAVRSAGLTADEARRAIPALVAYVAANRGHVVGGEWIELLPEHTWANVSKAPDEEFHAHLETTFTAIELEEPALEGLLAGEVAALRAVPTGALRAFIDALAAVAEENQLPAFLAESSRRMRLTDRFAGEFSTPQSLRRVMLAAAGPLEGRVADLACGEGGLLAEAYSQNHELRLTGVEFRAEAVQAARTTLFVSGADAEISNEDSLRLEPEVDLAFDFCIIDPPWGVRDWGDADLYTDPKWQFGAPGPQSADLAWVQLALMSLRPNGRAVVSLPSGSLWRGGREGAIRSSLIEAGVIEAVIQLPPRLRPETSIPTSLWVLRSPHEPSHPSGVLMIDLSGHGKRGRATTVMADEEIDWVAALLAGWRAGIWEPDEISWAATTSEILDNDAVLDPARYKPASSINWYQELAEGEEARRRLATATNHLVAAVDALQSIRLNPFPVLEVAPLHDAFTITSGRTRVRKSDAESEMAGVERVLTPQSIHNRTAELVPADQLEGKPVRCDRGDLVIALIGSIGEVCLVNEHLEGSLVSQNCAILKPLGSDSDAGWYLPWFRSQHFTAELERRVSGGAMRRLTINDLGSIEVPATPPSFAELRSDFAKLSEAESTASEVSALMERFLEVAVDLAYVETLPKPGSTAKGGQV